MERRIQFGSVQLIPSRATGRFCSLKTLQRLLQINQCVFRSMQYVQNCPDPRLGGYGLHIDIPILFGQFHRLLERVHPLRQYLLLNICNICGICGIAGLRQMLA